MPLSLVGTFGVMYLLGYSIDNLSLMALAIVTGFVVDDAIVVIENITRYLEAGDSPLQAALKGSQGNRAHGSVDEHFADFRVHSHPPDGRDRGEIIPRICRHAERGHRGFVVCFAHRHAHDVRAVPEIAEGHEARANVSWWASGYFSGCCARMQAGLRWVLSHQPLMLAVTIAAICLSVYLYIIVPKGFFPQQDTGRLNGAIIGAQDISFPAMRDKVEAVREDHQERPGRAQRDGIHRRRRGKYGANHRRVERY